MMKMMITINRALLKTDQQSAQHINKKHSHNEQQVLLWKVQI